MAGFVLDTGVGQLHNGFHSPATSRQGGLQSNLPSGPSLPNKSLAGVAHVVGRGVGQLPRRPGPA